jgi:transmembrane sensor
MSDVVRLRTVAEIEDEAAAWVWRLDSGTVAAADRQAFEAWVRRDPRHRRAFEELGGVWRSLDGLADAKRDEKIATFTEVTRRPHARMPGRRRWILAAVASIAAVALIPLLWQQRGNETQIVATSVGQQRSLTLADGSIVQLNTNSMLETKFIAASREVYLGKGEAHFTVAHDQQRPFRVHAGNTIVRAVGTEFDVRVRDDHSVEVIVTEGRVKVVTDARGAGTAAQTRRPSDEQQLVAGQRLLSLQGTETVEPISLAEASRALAWRQGAVVFAGEPLSVAVAELNRYMEVRFVVTDPAVGELRVGGHFKTDDVDGIVRGLESALPISIRRTDNGLIYIDPRH